MCKVNGRIVVSASDVSDGTMGVCLACGEEAYGVEPDARGYVCESCGEPKVYGLEEAVIMGAVDVREEDERRDFRASPCNTGDYLHD